MNSSDAMPCLCREEGIAAFWKGSVPQLIRIFPYSAAQLTSNDLYKRHLAAWSAGSGGAGHAGGGEHHPAAAAEGALTVQLRLVAGAMAGMTATALTHPLDVMRLRLALPKSPYTGE